MNTNQVAYKARAKRLRQAITQSFGVSCSIAQSLELIAKSENYPSWDALSGSTQKSLVTSSIELPKISKFKYEEGKFFSNSFPWDSASSVELTDLIMKQICPDAKDANGWTNRTRFFLLALIRALVFLRDNHSAKLNAALLLNYCDLVNLEKLAWKESEIYDGLSGAISGLRRYITNIPYYENSKMFKQSETCVEQHGFISSPVAMSLFLE